MKLSENPMVESILGFTCPFAVFWFPWYWFKSDTAILRRVKGRAVWKTAKGPGAKAILILKVLIWPIPAGVAVILSWLIYSKNIQTVSDKGRVRQLGELLLYTYWWGCNTRNYYTKRTILCRLGDVMDDFIPAEEARILNITIHHGKENLMREVSDKDTFALLSKERGVPAIMAEFLYSKGAEKAVAGSSEFPRDNLFFKAVDGSFGKEIERWEYQPDMHNWVHEDKRLTEPELHEYFKEASLKRNYILQKEARNHPSISQFSVSGLVTFRVQTVLGLHSEPETAGFLMAMPTKGMWVNHGEHGGIVASMNNDTQRLEIGIRRVPKYETFTHHPDTGAQIEGHYLEQWPQLRDLAFQAHKSFPEIFSIGWDLALTEEGPRVVEGNTLYGLGVKNFLGQTPYVPRYLEILRAEKAKGTWLGSLL